MNKVFFLAVTLITTLFFFVGETNAQTWTAPTAVPPNDNTYAPINISATAQSKIGGAIFNTGGATYGLLIPFGSVGIGTLTPTAQFHIYNIAPVTDLFRITAGANIVVVNSSGKVGIGTTTPSEKLEVAGNIKVVGNVMLSGVSPIYKITNVAVPTASSDVATKGYVDAQAAGGPASWTCTIRTAIATADIVNYEYGVTTMASCLGSEKVINGGCSSSNYQLIEDHPYIPEGEYGEDGTPTQNIRGEPSGEQGWACKASSGYSRAYANCCL